MSLALVSLVNIPKCDGQLVALPQLLPGYLPDLTRLPLYILRLATLVNWSSEEECFRSFCRHTAAFYSVPSPSSSWVHSTVLWGKKNTHPSLTLENRGVERRLCVFVRVGVPLADGQ
ncbi:MLH1 [Cordylochernes scorpioides]|uniref:MLH1 n=1 Tax=Cordylochernes scorpioides TaxID=51811 RepID=A0ABY6L526_9ARAC|nr:MLH1 [Cordylochernes scorpioides]